MLFRKNFFFEIVLFKIIFFFKIVLFKYARKTQIFRILRGKTRQNVIFCVQNFFKIELFKNNFFFKIVLFKNLFFFEIMLFKNLFFFKSWRVVKILIQNLTRREIFNSKSCFLNCIFRFWLNYYQRTTCWIMTTCWKITTAECKIFFKSVWYVFASRLLQSFSLLRSLGRLDSWWVCWLYHLHYQLIYINLFGFQQKVTL